MGWFERLGATLWPFISILFAIFVTPARELLIDLRWGPRTRGIVCTAFNNIKFQFSPRRTAIDLIQRSGPRKNDRPKQPIFFIFLHRDIKSEDSLRPVRVSARFRCLLSNLPAIADTRNLDAKPLRARCENWDGCDDERARRRCRRPDDVLPRFRCYLNVNANTLCCFPIYSSLRASCRFSFLIRLKIGLCVP